MDEKYTKRKLHLKVPSVLSRAALALADHVLFDGVDSDHPITSLLQLITKSQTLTCGSGRPSSGRCGEGG